MYQILDNGQVMKQDIGTTYEQWLPIGMEYEYKYDENGNVTETKKFNIQIGEWEVV